MIACRYIALVLSVLAVLVSRATAFDSAITFQGELPRTMVFRVRASLPLSAVRARAADLLGFAPLDAYLSVDGRRAEDEEQPISDVAVAVSRIAVHLRLKGGANGRDGTASVEASRSISPCP